MIKAEKIWRNGELIPWEAATTHVMAHALHYGTSVFEGIRCYKTTRGSEVFRLKEHVRRLYDSAKIYRMEIAFTEAEFAAAALETIRANRLQHCYIRPLIYRGVGAIGVNPLANPVETYILTWEWGKYLGDEAIEQGVDVCVSSWNRAAPNTFPTMAKAGGNYLNSTLVKMEAVTRGFAEGIALDTLGYVSEGSGENLFVV
ncbi:MAG: branched-chain amino acid transaminase, partial [Acidobacteriota bacterium]